MLKRIINEKAFAVSVFVVSLVGTAYCFLTLEGDRTRADLRADNAYRHLPPAVDLEHRTEQLGESWQEEPLDLSAFVGLPDEYRDLVSEYVQTVCREIGASPLMRKRYYHKDRSQYDRLIKRSREPFPDDVNPFYDRDIVVPITLFPGPGFIERWAASPNGQSMGWRTQEQALNHAGSVYGHTWIFKPHALNINPTTVPPSPIRHPIFHWDVYFEDASFFSGWGKLVTSPNYDFHDSGPLQDRFSKLDLGQNLLCEVVSVPAFIDNTRLRWVSSRKNLTERRYLAYALLDGNGGRRNASLLMPGGNSRYLRPLSCDPHQPRINQHDELLVPTPLAWSPTYDEVLKLNIQLNGPHEEWCLDDWFPAQQDACWVIRETAESKPLQESFVLIPAREKSDLPVFFVGLFAETQPVQLVKELAALYSVPAENVVINPESMERLNTLYKKVRDGDISRNHDNTFRP